MDFRKYIKKKYLKPSDRILEFGPLIRPTATKDTHPGIRFADVRSTEDIKKLYTSNEYLNSTGLTVDINEVVDIDYVIKDSYKKTFKGVEKFDVVILSHVIEHMPDIIDFFQDVKNVVKDDGRLIIVYPDARFCFDHFRNGTSFIDAYDVYTNKKSSSKRVFDFVYNVVSENNAWLFWNDKKESNLMPKNQFKDAVKAYEKSLEGELPDDTHFWPFSNYQLIKFLYDMDRAGLLGFDIEKFYPTPENHQECMVVLRPKKGHLVQFEKYKKILAQTSPYVDGIELRQGKQELDVVQERVNTLEAELRKLVIENDILSRELDAITSSKKWRYSKKIADLKHKILRNDKAK